MNPIERPITGIVVREDAEIPSVGNLLQAAVQQLSGPGAAQAVEALEKLVALHERVESRRAASEFAEAMANFQAECPAIPKTSKAKIQTKSGTGYSYTYAELDQIAKTVGPHLHSHGISYSWDSSIDSNRLRCTCTLRHRNGHSVGATFECPVDSQAAMSDAQKHAAALTYARRQSLIQVLGLTTCDPDNDGGQTNPATITENQIAAIECLLSEVGADRAKFLDWLHVGTIEEIPANSYRQAITALEQKRRKGTA